MAVQAEKINLTTLTNGSLLRFLPLSIWCTKTKIGKEKQIRDILELDASFTHPSPLVHDAEFILGVTVNYLLNNIDFENRA